jgi:hypothetical protein
VAVDWVQRTRHVRRGGGECMTAALYLVRESARAAHPEPEIAFCLRCGAVARESCVSFSGFMPDGFAHPERHAAAIEADGRTCEVAGG